MEGGGRGTLEGPAGGREGWKALKGGWRFLNGEAGGGGGLCRAGEPSRSGLKASNS